MKTILLFVPDLMFGSRIEDVARQLGYRAESVDAGGDIYGAIRQTNPALVVATFDRNGDAWEKVIAAAHAASIKALAFGSHMNIDAFKRARELGAEQVVANSRMISELPDLLLKLAGPP